MAIKELNPTAAESFQAIRRQRAATREYIAGRRTTLAAGCSADIVLSLAEYQELRAALVALRDGIVQLFPQDANGCRMSGS